MRCAELGARVDEGPYLVEEGGKREVVVQKVSHSLASRSLLRRALMQEVGEQ